LFYSALLAQPLSSLPEVLHVTPGVGDQADHR
jgi:hypothetical protein